MNLDNKISKSNKIPGCEQLTRPEEIQALSKYLGDLKEKQIEKETEKFKGLDTLFIPGRTTGKVPKITLEDHIDVLKDVGEIKTLNNTVLDMPGEHKEINLGKEKIKLENPLTSLQLDKTLITIDNNSSDVKLEEKLLKIKDESNVSLNDKKVNLNPDDKNISLDSSKIELSGDFKTTNLNDKKVRINNDIKLESLEDKKVSLSVNQDIKLENKKEKLNVTESTNLSDKKVDLKNINESTELSNKKVDLNNTNSKVSLEDKILGLIGDTKQVELSNKIITPINDLSSNVTGLYSTIDNSLRINDSNSPTLENELVNMPDSFSDETKLSLKQNIGEIKNAELELSGDALEYFKEISRKLIIQQDKLGAFNTVMSLYEDIKERDKAHAELWEKVIAALSMYGTHELPNKEKVSTDSLSSKVTGLPASSTKRNWESKFSTSSSSSGNTAVPSSYNVNLNDMLDSFVNPKAITLLADSNNSTNFYSSYLSNVIENWKETGIVSAKSWLSEFSNKTGNKIFNNIADFGINCLSNLQSKWSTNSSSSLSGNYSNSSKASNRLKWSLPGASKTKSTEGSVENLLFSKDILGTALEMGATYGADYLTGGCEWVTTNIDINNSKDTKGKTINKNYQNGSLNDIEDPKKNGYYLIGNTVYRYQNKATSNIKSLGDDIKGYGQSTVKRFASTPTAAVKNLTNKLINGSSELQSSTVYNRPKTDSETKSFEFPKNTASDSSTRKSIVEKTNVNLTSYTAKDNNSKYKGSSYLVLNGDNEKLNLKPSSNVFKERYLSSYGILTTLKELCDNASVPDSIEGLKDILKKSELITTVDNVGTSGLNNRFAQTLDSNGCWEIIIEPFVKKELNGGFSYLPAIQEINTINLAEHGINTGYNKWMPVSSFSLQKSKMNSKSIPLFDGEFSVPLAAELTNDLSISIIDDQYKSWRNYFQKVMDVSVYNSTPHEESYYKTGYDTLNVNKLTKNMNISKFDDANIINLKRKNVNLVNSKIESLGSYTNKYSGQWIPTAVDKSAECTALYKNITFRIRIYVMTQQYSTIRKFDLLAVLRDFTEEFNGDTDYSAADLNLNFSIVGEDPDHYVDPYSYSQTIWDWWKKTDEYVEEKKIALRLRTTEGTTEQVDDTLKKNIAANTAWELTKKQEKTLAVKAALAALAAKKQKEEETEKFNNSKQLVIMTCAKISEDVVKGGFTGTKVSYKDKDGNTAVVEIPTTNLMSLCQRNFSTKEELAQFLKENPDLSVVTDTGFLTYVKGIGSTGEVSEISYQINGNEETLEGVITTNGKEYLRSVDILDRIKANFSKNFYGNSTFDDDGNFIDIDPDSKFAKTTNETITKSIYNGKQLDLITKDMALILAEDKFSSNGEFDDESYFTILEETIPDLIEDSADLGYYDNNSTTKGLWNALGGTGQVCKVLTSGAALIGITSLAVVSGGTFLVGAAAGLTIGASLVAVSEGAAYTIDAVGEWWNRDNVEEYQELLNTSRKAFYDYKDSDEIKQKANLIVQSSNFTTTDKGKNRLSETVRLRENVVKAQKAVVEGNKTLKQWMETNHVKLGDDIYQNYEILGKSIGVLAVQGYYSPDDYKSAWSENDNVKKYTNCLKQYKQHLYAIQYEEGLTKYNSYMQSIKQQSDHQVTNNYEIEKINLSEENLNNRKKSTT